MPTNIANSESSAAEPVGKAAEKKTPDRAADADRADQKHGRRFRHAVIDGVGREMDERHEHAESAEQTGGIETEEAL